MLFHVVAKNEKFDIDLVLPVKAAELYDEGEIVYYLEHFVYAPIANSDGKVNNFLAVEYMRYDATEKTLEFLYSPTGALEVAEVAKLPCTCTVVEDFPIASGLKSESFRKPILSKVKAS